ncbi:MAG: RdgB/HAM1 family non-canonical purine NTP pyrophosphatase [SAR202 cluster bacterium]|nr:RdgB/HAM1 family non-canonical purine NTP pyrophosphatase [SAR202 cluster bacterium]
MRHRLLIATNNAHKVVEFNRIIGDPSINLVAPRELGLRLDVAEDGTTYRQNALLKARAFAQASGMPAIADDSGIEVAALDGRPGLHSARYGGPGLDDAGRTRLLLRELRAVPDGARGCRYVAAIAMVWPDGREEAFEGTCKGVVARDPLGDKGFGYDPIFYSPAHGMTIAQMQADVKDAFSHRGHALRQAVAYLRSLAGQAAAG